VKRESDDIMLPGFIGYIINLHQRIILATVPPPLSPSFFSSIGFVRQSHSSAEIVSLVRLPSKTVNAAKLFGTFLRAM